MSFKVHIVSADRTIEVPTGATILETALEAGRVVAVVGEAIADAQMEAFRRDPATKGQVMNRGLWRYSRHPNYFFESLHWIAYVPLAIGSPWWWLALLPAVGMAWLLLKMSGVPILERHLVQSRPGYADYMRTTSVFIPWPPKR